MNHRSGARIGRLLAVAACTVMMASCGGKGDDNPFPWVSKQAGRFIDVQGLGVSSGKTTGTTGPAGEFQYEVTFTQIKNGDSSHDEYGTNPLTFYLLSDVPLPGAGGPPLPETTFGYGSQSNFNSTQYQMLYMSPYTVSTDQTVQKNVMLALLMADADGDPTNGIQIPDAVSKAKLGGTVNWYSADPRTDLAPLRAAIKAADPSGTHEWPADDAAAAAHWHPVWSCALSGRYSGNVNDPNYTDTDGAQKTFQGSWTLFAMPTNSVGRLTFSTAPYTFDGEFRLTASSMQPGPIVPLTSTQYVDTGEYAPQSTPQVPVALNAALGLTPVDPQNLSYTVPVTGSWNGGGYSAGKISQGKRTDICLNTNTHDDTDDPSKVTGDCHPFVAKYKFLLFPVYIQQLNYDGTLRGVNSYVLHVEIDQTGKKALVYFEDQASTSAVSYPVVGTLDAANNLNVQLASKTFPTGYTWKFAGTFHPETASFTNGELDYGDGTHVVFDTTTPLVGCSTVGTTI